MAFITDISKNEFSSHLMNGRNQRHEKRQSSPGLSARLMWDSLECPSELGVTSESICSTADFRGQQPKTPGDCMTSPRSHSLRQCSWSRSFSPLTASPKLSEDTKKKRMQRIKKRSTNSGKT